MANISKRNRRRERELRNAAKNRREIIAARLSRRDMIRAGLLTSAGYLIQKNGLSARAQFSGDCDNRWRDGSGGNGTPVSPPTTPFVEPLPIPPIAQSVPSLSPAPTVVPNIAAGEGRTRNHQALTTLPPVKFYEVHQREALISMHPDYPLQRVWTFNGTVPGQTYVARYGEPILVRNFNDLPNDNGGFGIQSVSTHLHNGHTPSESDGFPCDFFGQGKFYDQHYPNVLAGFASSHPPTGDIRESMSTLIKDKIVVINFMYVKCEGICMPITTNLKRVQKLLGDRIGRDISMYSITLKPEEDTPAKLKQYVKAHHIKPGWTFLTGKPDEITTLRRSLGFKDAKQKLDQDLTNHTGMVKYGNEPRLWWAMFPGKANAPWIAECIQWMYGPNGNPIPRAELDKAMGTEPGHKHAKT